MHSKQELYNMLKNFIYANNFEDLNVFSKYFLHSVIVPNFSNNKDCAPYSLLYIDFNDMNEINKNGIKLGDKILHDTISLILSTLPPHTSCLRQGGDEFVFIIKGTTSNVSIIDKVNNILKLNATQIDNTTVTSYCLNSTQARTFGDMIDIADNEVSFLKHSKNETNSQYSDEFSEESKWVLLRQKMENNFNTFFNNLRFHKFPMKIEDLKKIYMHSINATISLFNSPDSTKANTQQLHFPNKNKKIDYSEFSELANLILEKNKLPEFEELEAMHFENYKDLIQYLSRDSLTQNFNEAYLKYLLYERNMEFNALYFSTAFIKLSNTLHSLHSATDEKIQILVNSLSSYLSNYIDLENELFCEGQKNYLINLSGGDLFLLLNPKIDVNNIDINSFIQGQSNSNFDKDNLLRLSVSDGFTLINKDNYIIRKDKQSEEAKINKNEHIFSILDNTIIENALNIILADSVATYKELFPNYKTNINSQRNFIELLAQTGLNLYSSLNIVQSNVDTSISSNVSTYPNTTSNSPKANIDNSRDNDISR